MSDSLRLKLRPWNSSCKYNLDFQLVHIPSSPTVTAAMLGGDAEVTKVDPRAKKDNVDDLVPRPFLYELEKSGLFEKLWKGKR